MTEVIKQVEAFVEEFTRLRESERVLLEKVEKLEEKLEAALTFVRGSK
jgi:hypothetical protein